MSKEEIDEKPILSFDDEMEEPMTKSYDAPTEMTIDEPEGDSEEPEMDTDDEPDAPDEPKVVFKKKFREDIDNTIGTLGWDRKIGSPEIFIQVNQVMELIDAVVIGKDDEKGKPLTEQQANSILEMIAKAPYCVIADVMKTLQTNASEYYDIIGA